MGRMLAIDSGLTVTKAIVFDIPGAQIGASRRNVPKLKPAPRGIECDMSSGSNLTLRPTSFFDDGSTYRDIRMPCRDPVRLAAGLECPGRSTSLWGHR